MSLLRTLFGFDGRIDRATFWLCGCAVGLMDLAAALIIQAWAHGAFFSDNVPHRPDGAIVGVGMILLVVAVVSGWSMLALQVKRCHDLGRSGWWASLDLIPVLGSLWLLYDLGFKPGDAGNNAYGEPAGTIDPEEWGGIGRLSGLGRAGR